MLLGTKLIVPDLGQPVPMCTVVPILKWLMLQVTCTKYIAGVFFLFCRKRRRRKRRRKVDQKKKRKDKKLRKPRCMMKRPSN
jgi:hypothetical protein